MLEVKQESVYIVDNPVWKSNLHFVHWDVTFSYSTLLSQLQSVFASYETPNEHNEHSPT